MFSKPSPLLLIHSPEDRASVGLVGPGPRSEEPAEDRVGQAAEERPAGLGDAVATAFRARGQGAVDPDEDRRKPGGAVRGEHANLTGLVLGCIEAKFCK